MVHRSPWHRDTTHLSNDDTADEYCRATSTPPRSTAGTNRIFPDTPPKSRRDMFTSARLGRSPAPPLTPLSRRAGGDLEDSPPPSPTRSRRKLRERAKHDPWQDSRVAVKEETSESELDPLAALERKLDSAKVKGFPSERLLEHQVTARKFMMRSESSRFKGGLLLDDVGMGLGKTIEILARICDSKFIQKETGPTCIVFPASILKQWESQIKKFTPALKVLVQMGKSRTQDPKTILGYDIVLVSFETLRSDWKKWKSGSPKDTDLFKTQLLRVILDEGHEIGNPKTLQSQACMDLTSKYKWLSSGTAIRGSANEMLVYFKFLRVATPEQIGLMYGDATRIAKFRAPFTIGRKKTDIIDGKPIVKLPSRTIEVIQVNVEDEDEAEFIRGIASKDPVSSENKYLHAQRFKDGPEGPKCSLTKLLRQQQAACIPRLTTTIETQKDSDEYQVDCQICSWHVEKIDSEFCDRCLRGETPEAENASLEDRVQPPSSKQTALLKLIRKIHAGEKHPKIVIFSSWTEALDHIKTYLEGMGYPCVQYDGRTDKTSRDQILQSFAASKHISICLVSIKAGGIGLNLNFCNHAIMFNPSWSAVEEDQAFDRLYRIGQEREVKCYKLIVPDTIETRIVRKQNLKRQVQDAVWSAGGCIDDTQSTPVDAELDSETDRSKKWYDSE